MERVTTGSGKAPRIMPLGDSAVLVRFGSDLDEAANRNALALAAELLRLPITGVLEVVPSLVSVLVRYDPQAIDGWRLAGEIGLRLTHRPCDPDTKTLRIGVLFDGPDLAEVAEALGLSVADFINRHNEQALRVLTTGFAPGFVYCGFHAPELVVPRRTAVRPKVAVGSVLFAAGQTAIAATEIPTGWHVIGHTGFRNFEPERDPPTRLRAGDVVVFEAVS